MFVTTRPAIGARGARQGGSALIIAILVLLLLTIAVFVAMPAMLGEQRASGNETRAKIAQHVADAGLSHGREIMRIKGAEWIPIAKQPVGAGWTRCLATNVQFPCGAIKAGIRANHYYRGASLPATLTFPVRSVRSTAPLRWAW